MKFQENELYARREDYTPTTLSDDIIFITSGVDIQGDRIEIEFKGFGLGYENWGIKHSVLYGDTKQSDMTLLSATSCPISIELKNVCILSIML